MAVPYSADATGVILRVRVTPNAAAERIEGVESRDDDTAVLRIRVTAVPDRGKANKAVIALLAKALGVPKSAITVLSGETARFKTLHIGGDAEPLMHRLRAL